MHCAVVSSESENNRLECLAFASTALNHIDQETSMQIRLASVMVENQEKALRFYTVTLGFVKNKDIPMGQFRWLTVPSREGAEGVELVLESMSFFRIDVTHCLR